MNQLKLYYQVLYSFLNLLYNLKDIFMFLISIVQKLVNIKQKKSLLYISLSDDNFEEKLVHVLSLPEYKMVSSIELVNITIY